MQLKYSVPTSFHLSTTEQKENAIELDGEHAISLSECVLKLTVLKFYHFLVIIFAEFCDLKGEYYYLGISVLKIRNTWHPCY